MILDPAAIEAIAVRVADLLRATPPAPVISMREAMTRCGCRSPQAFQRWAAHMGLRSLSGAKGRYSVAALDAAIERASRPRRRAA